MWGKKSAISKRGIKNQGQRKKKEEEKEGRKRGKKEEKKEGKKGKKREKGEKRAKKKINGTKRGKFLPYPSPFFLLFPSFPPFFHADATASHCHSRISPDFPLNRLR